MTAVHDAAVAHLVAMGPCENLVYQDDDYCPDTDCTYCVLSRAVQEAEKARERPSPELRQVVEHIAPKPIEAPA